MTSWYFPVFTLHIKHNIPWREFWRKQYAPILIYVGSKLFAYMAYRTHGINAIEEIEKKKNAARIKIRSTSKKNNMKKRTLGFLDHVNII